jgi:NADH dehydrogenase
MDVTVTGAFSFTGSYVARDLLRRGHAVRTLTSHPQPPAPWAQGIAAAPFSFDDPPALVTALRGSGALVNTYWMRFPRKGLDFPDVVRNTSILIESAKKAGIRRLVHLSVANAALDAPFAYYRAKAEAEEIVRTSGLSYAIVRPTWIFGEGDVLLNNLAWMLHLPVFPVVGRGRYPVQPVFVGDVARLVADLVEDTREVTLDAAGPDKMQYRDFARVLKRSLGKRRFAVPTPPPLALLAGKATGLLLRDVVMTRDEMGILRQGLMASTKPPLGTVRLEDWLRENGATVGRRWTSDLERHFRGVDLEPFKRGPTQPA